MGNHPTTQNQPIKLECFHAMELPADAGQSFPEEICLLKWGENQTTKGIVRVGPKTLASFSANQKERGYEKVALDYEHNTLPGTPEYDRTQEPREVAGYAMPIIRAGEGLFLSAIKLTADGETKSKNFADLSPAVELDANREVVFLHSTALCRNGSVHGLEIGFFSTQPSTQNQKPMDQITLQDLATALGCEATKEAVLAKLGTLASLLAMPKEIEAMSARVKVVEAFSVTATHDANEAERARLIADSTKDGQIIPLSAETLKTVDIAVLRDLVKNAPKNVVPLSAAGKPTGAQADDVTGSARLARAWSTLKK